MDLVPVLAYPSVALNYTGSVGISGSFWVGGWLQMAHVRMGFSHGPFAAHTRYMYIIHDYICEKGVLTCCNHVWSKILD